MTPLSSILASLPNIGTPFESVALPKIKPLADLAQWRARKHGAGPEKPLLPAAGSVQAPNVAMQGTEDEADAQQHAIHSAVKSKHGTHAAQHDLMFQPAQTMARAHAPQGNHADAAALEVGRLPSGPCCEERRLDAQCLADALVDVQSQVALACFFSLHLGLHSRDVPEMFSRAQTDDVLNLGSTSSPERFLYANALSQPCMVSWAAE